MDPFRDELAAAHAKIAQLENRVRELQTMRVDATHSEKSSQPSILLLVAAAALGLVMAGGAFIIYRQTRQPSDPLSESFKGIATAPENTSDVIPPVVNPGAVASSSAKPNASAKCNCTPGDPLCTCL
jgi:hypothetical protein